MAKAWAYIAIVLCIVTTVIAIASAGLPNYFRTMGAGYDSDGFYVTNVQYLGPFRECRSSEITIHGVTGGADGCSKTGNDCRVFLSDAQPKNGPIFPVYIYSGSCAYFNTSRAFLLLGIFISVATTVLSTLFMFKFSKGRSEKLFYMLTLGAFILNLGIFLISFATYIVFHGKVVDSYNEYKAFPIKPVDLDETSFEFGPIIYLSILNFVVALAAAIVFAWFGRPDGESKYNFNSTSP
jgi:hypothetical protein